MNKKFYPVIGIVIALVLLLSFLVFTKKSPNTKEAVSNQTSTPSQSTTLRELLASNYSQTCEFKDEASSTTGTFYFSKGKMRGDLISKANNSDYKVHTYSDGSTVYMWSDAQAEGIKMSIDKTTVPTGSPSNTQQVDLDKKVDYTCQNWQEDQSKFELPQNVNFKEFSSMMLESTPMPVIDAADEAQKCKACDNLPTDAKTQCLQILNCK